MSAELAFAGDEAGDASFSFAHGASSHFVFALIATSNPDALRAVLDKVRIQRGLPAGYEFTYHALTSDVLRETVFQALRSADFASWAITVDKRLLPDVFRSLGSHAFYAFFVSELIGAIPEETRRGAVLLLDEFDPSGYALLALKRALKQKGIPRGFRKMTNVRSRSESLAQVADLVAGALLRKQAKGDGSAFEFVRSQFKLLREYRP
ncbi:MAG: DUF3800 domain-containing protein [Chloroflexi bacterium]|nr:DUF3800 domain-containing protein [Chloroflexota bacterium]